MVLERVISNTTHVVLEITHFQYNLSQIFTATHAIHVNTRHVAYVQKFVMLQILQHINMLSTNWLYNLTNEIPITTFHWRDRCQ